MMTAENSNFVANLPSDLRTLVDEACLLDMVLGSVANDGVAGPKLFNGSSGEGALSAPMMLTLTAYSYAIGIFASRDIEVAIYKDQTLRYICARQYPTWHDIRRFRRLHRELVQKILCSVLRQLCVQYLFRFYPELAENLPASDLDAQIAAAVTGRIEAAIIMDGVEIDV